MTVRYLLRRSLTFLLVIWISATLNFALPRMVPGDPIQAMLSQLETQGQIIENRAAIIEAYRERFGVDDPILIQYLKYLESLVTLDLGYSINYFPATVIEIIMNSLPWSLALLSVTTVISFVVGTLLGGLFVWRGTPTLLKALTGFFFAVSPLPYYLIAILLLFFFGFTLDIFPTGGLTSIGRVPGFNWETFLDIMHHSILPALSLMLATIGTWALSMRSMMVIVQGEDYLLLARAKGIRERRILIHYALRNALLPQITSFGISLARVVSGATLVEVLFTYPGVGSLLFRAISNLDYSLMQGILFILTVVLAASVLIVDLLYPKLDPRITYEES